MALNLSIDLSEASFGDLVALVDAARSAGMDPQDSIDFDGKTLSLKVDVDAFFPSFEDRRPVPDVVAEDDLDSEVVDEAGEDFFGAEDGWVPRGPRHRRDGDPRRGQQDFRNRSPFDFVDTSGIGDAAIRSVIDILTGRQDPPRGRN